MRKPLRVHTRRGILGLDDRTVAVHPAPVEAHDAVPDRLVAAARRLQAALDARALRPVAPDTLGWTWRKR